MATSVAAPVCRCGFVITPSNSHKNCAEEAQSTLREADGARSAYLPRTDLPWPALHNAGDDLPPAPPRPIARAEVHPARSERLVEIRTADGQLGEHVDLMRHPNGAVALAHVIPGMVSDCVILTADEAANLTAWLLRTMRGECPELAAFTGRAS